MNGLYELLASAAIAALILGLNVCEVYAGRVRPLPPFRIKKP